jgi:hypothetical protein
MRDLFEIWHPEVEFLQEKRLTPYFSVSLASGTVFSCEETKIPLAIYSFFLDG